MSMQERITGSVRAGLPVSFLEVVNESGGHNVPAGSETHFKVVVVSPAFAGLSAVKRHQAVYALLRAEMTGGVHALALHAYTDAEWAARQSSPDSPACHGGSKRDQH